MSIAKVGIGVHSPITALLAEDAGADVLWLGSLEVSTSRGVPDRELVTPDCIAQIVADIRAVSALPIYVDGDTGYGSDEFGVRATRLYEEAGADAICIEDNVFPKRNSLDDRVHGRKLVDPQVFARRLESMIQARRSISIIARTEALVAGMGPAEAVRRLTLYAEAGADALFAQANLASADQLMPVVQRIAPMRPMVLAPTVLPEVSVDDFARHGPVTVIFANVVIRTVVAQTSKMLRTLMAARSLEAVAAQLAGVETLFELSERQLAQPRRPAANAG